MEASLQLLERLAEQRKQILARMDMIRRIPKKGGILHEGGAVTLVEDSDDVKVMLLAPRLELENLENQILSQLSRIKDLGLADYELVGQLTKELRVSV